MSQLRRKVELIDHIVESNKLELRVKFTILNRQYRQILEYLGVEEITIPETTKLVKVTKKGAKRVKK